MAGMRTIVLRGQELLDLAIQEYGSVEGLFDLLADNPQVPGLSAVLAPGQQLRVASAPSDRDVRTYYQENALHPASGDVITPDSGDWNADWNEDFS